MSRAAKRHQKKLARKAALKQRLPPPQANRPAAQTAPADYLSALTEKGLALHLAGRLAEAEAIYRQVLEAKPGHAGANHLLGGLAHQAGEHERAVGLISKAIAKAPRHPDYCNSLGNALRALGRLDEAAASYRKAIANNPKHAEAHNNLANIFLDQGRPDDAAAAYGKALAIKPDYAEAHYNLGNVLQGLGRGQDAAASYRAAIGLNSNFAQAHNNLGNLLNEAGQSEDAIASYQRALAINSGYAEAHYNLGAVLYMQGRTQDALARYRRAIVLNPRNDSYWSALAACLETATFASADASLFADLLSLCERPTVRSNSVGLPVVSALRHHPDFSRILELAANPLAKFDIGEAAGVLAGIPLFLRVIEQSHINDLDVENMLTRLRRDLLEAALAGTYEDRALPFSAALALHCFTNEYVFSETIKERAAVEDLERRIAELAEKERAVPPAQLAALASYRPLHRYPWAARLGNGAWPEVIQPVITRQIAEPAEERSLRAGIPRLTAIDSEVSRAVREQYEENPYPRWIKVDIERNPKSLHTVLTRPPLEFDLGDYQSVDSPKILIAGCGTGQHALIPATNYKNARVLAIDLSLSSLTYAARKTRELGFSNVEYAQADITRLAALDRKFDLIESSGVLHHLGDPMLGWRVLVDLLRPGGLMKIGLYSEAAREPVVRARALIAERGYTTSPEDIRRCREDILEMAREEGSAMAKLVEFRDFYSLSECRDLIFHVQEHRFTLPRIEAALATLKLRFLGFEMRDPAVLREFTKAYPQPGSTTSLALWDEFESGHRDTFWGMYQFWCRKM
ncbi:MAG: tetratricopeptide repeat protein [Alphaproteobacteria bacterium]